MTIQEDIYRCHCGLHLFDTRTGTVAHDRHQAHLAAWREDVQSQLDRAIAAWGARDPETGPCAHCRKPCRRYGDGGKPLCGNCQAAQQ